MRLITKYNQIARIAFEYSSNLLDSLSLFIKLSSIATYFPITRILKLQQTYKTIRLQKNNTSATVILENGTDVGLLIEIFAQKVYSHKTLPSAQTILDLGANIGFASIYFALNNISAHIYAIEAIPQIFERLKKNTASLKNITCINAAITDTNGTTDFFYNKDATLSSSSVNRGDTFEQVTVNTKTLDTLCNEHGITKIDLMKFDIEGSEFNVFKNTQSKHIISHITGEYHVDLAGHSVSDFIALFKGWNIHAHPINSLRYIIEGSNNHVH